MRPFILEQPRSLEQATASMSSSAPDRMFLAGGTTLLDLMKLDVLRPSTLVSLGKVQGLDAISKTDHGLRLGSLIKMADAAQDPTVAHDYPVIAQSLLLAASAQLRNMASLGGNVLQRTRCAYYRDTSFTACNKRNAGSGCAAIGGVNSGHAVLGSSEHCIAVYPGDFAAALMVLDALMEISGPTGVRTSPFADLHRLPGSTPQIETSLAPGEFIAAFILPQTPFVKRSRYVKVRDRQSYEFAAASAAVVLDMDGAKVREARIALGGLATKPWRALEAEALLKGRVLDEATAMEAAHAAFAAAKAQEMNAYKIPLGKATLVRALLETAPLEA